MIFRILISILDEANKLFSVQKEKERLVEAKLSAAYQELSRIDNLLDNYFQKHP